jgi:hypothetical protein
MRVRSLGAGVQSTTVLRMAQSVWRGVRRRVRRMRREEDS